MAESSLLLRLFSGCGGWVLLGSAGFSRGRAQAVERWLSGCGSEAESLRWAVASSHMRDQTCVLCIGRQVLYPWATREALKKFFFYIVVEYTKSEIYHFNHFLILIFIVLLVYFWPCWVFIAPRVFSLWGLWLRRTGSRLAGFSSRGSWAGAQAQQLWRLPLHLAQWWRIPCRCTSHKRCRFDPWVEKIPWRKKWWPTPVFLPRKFRRQRSLTACSPQGHKESDMTERLSTHARA